MIVTEIDNKVKIEGLSDFDPEKIFECGQCFRWDKESEKSYVGVVGEKVARVEKDGDIVYISGGLHDFEIFWKDYFDLNFDYEFIRDKLSVDEYMLRACEFGKGIRILKQDPWETLCSFIFSQCNNITRIKGIIKSFCKLFGDRIDFEGKEYFSFPNANVTAQLTADDLQPIHCGYRAEYIIDAARCIASSKINLEEISEMPEENILAELMKIKGVGKKVANCMILFGLHRLDAFPIDVWIRRVISANYGETFDKGIFGEYAGIAQQYMFYYARSGEKGKNGRL